MNRILSRALAFFLASVTTLAMAASDGIARPGASPSLKLEEKALVPGKFGKAVSLGADSREVSIPIPGILKERPVTFAYWVKLNDFASFNIIMSVAAKSGKHWELFTPPNSGTVSLFIPGAGDFPSKAKLQAGQWHYLALRFETRGFELYVDGKKVLEHALSEDLVFDEQPLILGAILGESSLHCGGAVDDLVISRGIEPLEGVVPDAPARPSPSTLAIFPFDEVDETGVVANAVSTIQARVKDDLMLPVGDRFLDEVEEDARNRSTLHGDEAVETESLLPVRRVVAEPSTPGGEAAAPPSLSLDGEWLLEEGRGRDQALLAKKSTFNKESEGITGGWFKESADRSAWRKVQVPTSVQSALLKLGEIPDPLFGANTWDELQEHGYPKELPWNFRHTRIERGEWWFARQFEVPKDWEGKRIRLAFDGLDYAGSVFLNGELLGYHAGMFGGPELDIGKAVRFGKANTLVVRLDPAPDNWFGILKGSPGWGWHYGHLISLGIWRGVKIEQVPEVRVCDLFVRTKSIRDDKAVLLVQYDVVNDAAESRDVAVNGTIAGKNFSAPPSAFVNRLSAPNGRSRWQTEVTLDRPELWWPLNYGEQNLYDIRLQTRVAADGAAIAGPRTAFGVRTIEMRPLRGAKAEQDYRWQFVINGVPMFIKGANWCWSDPMLQCDPAKYEHLLELARRAGIQMFRAWGGGIIETDEFYRLCDEKGIMVYQEFPYCWGPPTFPMTDGAVLDQQVSRVV